MDLLGRGIQGLDWKELREQRERRLLNNNWRSELWPTGNFMRLLTAGSVVVLLTYILTAGSVGSFNLALYGSLPCIAHTPTPDAYPLFIYRHPYSAIQSFCPRAAYYPASIEVTLEKSVIGALKRNVGIATEQPPPSGLATAVPRQCEILTRKRLDIYAT